MQTVEAVAFVSSGVRTTAPGSAHRAALLPMVPCPRAPGETRPLLQDWPGRASIVQGGKAAPPLGAAGTQPSDLEGVPGVHNADGRRRTVRIGGDSGGVLVSIRGVYMGGDTLNNGGQIHFVRPIIKK